MDKTLNPPESTYKTTFLVLSRIWYKICTRAWSPFPLIIPWKTMNLFIDNVLVRFRFIGELIERSGLVPWEYEYLFPVALYLPSFV